MEKKFGNIPISYVSVTAHPSLNKIMANLGHVHEGLKTPTLSHPNLQALQNAHQLEMNSRNSSAALLSCESVPHQPTLRKSSSSIDWNGAVAEATRKASRQFDWNGALFEKSRKPSFNQVGAVFQQHHQQNKAPSDEPTPGLVMSSLDRKTSSAGTVSVMQAARTETNAFAQAATASGNMATISITQPIEQHHEPAADRPHGSGVFGGVFQRGFFSKPVIRTDEENYRYIMALDR